MSVKPHPLNPILVVDDEAPILLAIDTALQMAGFNNVETCQDSRRVMDRLAGQPVEVLLLDLTMPHLDGEETFREMRRLRGDVKAILSSGYNEQEVTKRVQADPFQAFVQKPYSREALLTCLRDVLAAR